MWSLNNVLKIPLSSWNKFDFHFMLLDYNIYKQHLDIAPSKSFSYAFCYFLLIFLRWDLIRFNIFKIFFKFKMLFGYVLYRFKYLCRVLFSKILSHPSWYLLETKDLGTLRQWCNLFSTYNIITHYTHWTIHWFDNLQSISYSPLVIISLSYNTN